DRCIELRLRGDPAKTRHRNTTRAQRKDSRSRPGSEQRAGRFPTSLALEPSCSSGLRMRRAHSHATVGHNPAFAAPHRNILSDYSRDDTRLDMRHRHPRGDAIPAQTKKSLESRHNPRRTTGLESGNLKRL